MVRVNRSAEAISGGASEITPASGLDIEVPEALEQWLRATGRLDAGVRVRMTRLAGGVSNRTVQVDFPSGQSWVLKQALSRLRVAVEWLSDPARIQREAAGMRVLHELAPPGTIPRLVFEEPQHHVLAMETVASPHENWKHALLLGQVDLDLARQFGHLLATIHGRSISHASRLRPWFEDRTFFEGLRLEPFYEFSARALPAHRTFLLALAEETRTQRQALVHGDYSPKNILVHQGRLVLLDHEVIHWGDPMFDVGFALAHLLCKAHARPATRGLLHRAAVEFTTAYFDEIPVAMRSETQRARASRHGLACLLARVVGRSPVDYLSQVAQTRQVGAVAEVLAGPLPDPRDLAGALLDRIAAREI